MGAGKIVAVIPSSLEDFEAKPTHSIKERISVRNFSVLIEYLDFLIPSKVAPLDNPQEELKERRRLSLPLTLL